MCLNLSKIFGPGPDNIPSHSSEKPLFAAATTRSADRNVDEDNWSLPPVQISQYDAIQRKQSARHLADLPSSHEIGRANMGKTSSKKKKEATASISSYNPSPVPHAISSPNPIHSYAFTSSLTTTVSAQEALWISGATAYVKEYMRVFDPSHDFAHVQRVLQYSMHILDCETRSNPSTRFDPTIVALSAILHDVGDKKYIQKAAMAAALQSAGKPKRLAFADEEPATSSSSEDNLRSPIKQSANVRNHSRPSLHDPQLQSLLSIPHSDPETLVKRLLLTLGAPQEIARTIQKIVKNVSYSHEILDPAHVRGVILRHPELAIVQDADRLDALGAVGIGRCFTYGGAEGNSEFLARFASSASGGSRHGSILSSSGATAPPVAATPGTSRSLQDSVQHFEDKLLKLEGMMKTKEGKRMAKVRTERLRVFRGWWDDEIREAGGCV